MTANQRRALELWAAGHTGREIGKELGVSPRRAYQLIARAVRLQKQHDHPETTASLSYRAQNRLAAIGIPEGSSRETVKRTLEQLRTSGQGLPSLGLGRLTLKEIDDWIGKG